MEICYRYFVIITEFQLVQLKTFFRNCEENFRPLHDTRERVVFRGKCCAGVQLTAISLPIAALIEAIIETLCYLCHVYGCHVIIATEGNPTLGLSTSRNVPTNFLAINGATRFLIFGHVPIVKHCHNRESSVPTISQLPFKVTSDRLRAHLYILH